MMVRTFMLSAVAMLGCIGSLALAAQPGGHDPRGLAVGQNAKLLQITRDTNAGLGNGSELYRKCSFTGSAHNMNGLCSYQDRDPGNAQQHNQSPECDDALFCDSDS